MARCSRWSHQGLLPPIPDLVLAERFVAAARPDRDAWLWLLLASLVLDFGRTTRQPWSQLDVGAFLSAHVPSVVATIDPCQAEVLVTALASFLSWLRDRGELEEAAHRRLSREVEAHGPPRCRRARVG